MATQKTQKEFSDDVSNMCAELGLTQETNIAGIITVEGSRFHVDYKQKWVDVFPDSKTNPDTYNKVMQYFNNNGFTTNSSHH